MDGETVFGVLATFILCCLGSCATGSHVTERRMQAEAIERQYAEYDSTTGEWRWKEKPKP